MNPVIPDNQGKIRTIRRHLVSGMEAFLNVDLLQVHVVLENYKCKKQLHLLDVREAF